VHQNCRATIGQVGNVEHSLIKLARPAASATWVAGPRARHGDEPRGSPDGRRRGPGRRRPHPVSPWGKPAKGGKTRPKNKLSNKFIIHRRTK